MTFGLPMRTSAVGGGNFFPTVSVDAELTRCARHDRSQQLTLFERERGHMRPWHCDGGIGRRHVLAILSAGR